MSVTVKFPQVLDRPILDVVSATFWSRDGRLEVRPLVVHDNVMADPFVDHPEWWTHLAATLEAHVASRPAPIRGTVTRTYSLSEECDGCGSSCIIEAEASALEPLPGDFPEEGYWRLLTCACSGDAGIRWE